MVQPESRFDRELRRGQTLGREEARDAEEQVARDQELLAVKRELAKVKRERDCLRDAAAFFDSESK